MANSDKLPKQFDIVVVPFPYSDQLAEKRRPALVVSSNAFNKKHGLLWVIMITSAANPARPDDIAVAANSDRKSTRLNSSHLRLSRMPSSA